MKLNLVQTCGLAGIGAALLMAFGAGCGGEAASRGSTRIVCSTFPVYQITRNVTQGREGIEVELLLPASLGCPHHYSLTPQDMQKLRRAHVLIVNGLGMEEFLGAPVGKANPDLVVMDSSRKIENLLQYGGHRHERHHASQHNHPRNGRSEIVNPHLFASPRMVALLAMNIGSELARADPAGESLYIENATAYAAAMNAMADEMKDLVKGLKNRRIVQPHGVFDYLARDIGLEVIAVTQPHGLEPSAAEMLELIRVIREKDAGLIVTEPQYSSKVGQTIARETGIATAVLDPVASGPSDAPLNYYETVMRNNMKTLKATLGVQP